MYLKNLVLSENSERTEKSHNRKSFDSFKKFFPEAGEELYEQFYELIIADYSEFSEN